MNSLLGTPVFVTLDMPAYRLPSDLHEPSHVRPDEALIGQGSHGRHVHVEHSHGGVTMSTAEETLKHIANLVHAGGLARLEESEVVSMVRCLTLKQWSQDSINLTADVQRAVRAAADAHFDHYKDRR